MTPKNSVLSYNEFLANMDEGTFSDAELKEFENHWPKLQELAQALLTHMPSIGFFSKRKRRLAYHYIDAKLTELVNKKAITEEHKGLIIALLMYSSPDFEKAYFAHLDRILLDSDNDTLKSGSPDIQMSAQNANSLYDADDNLPFGKRIKRLPADIFAAIRRNFWRGMLDSLMILTVLFLVIWLFNSDNNAVTQIVRYLAGDYTGTTTGTILRSRLTRSTIRKSTYLPDVKYTYSVGNQFYISSDVFIFYNQEVDAKTFVLKYPEGMQVTVHYDKKWPGWSVLELAPPRLNDWELFFIIISIAITAASVLPTKAIKINLLFAAVMFLGTAWVCIILDMIYT